MEEIVLVGDIPQDVLDQVSSHLLQYSVGLAGGEAGAPPNEMTIVGSGTLIQLNHLYAILTADHVIGCLLGTEENCKSFGSVGVVLPYPGKWYERAPLVILVEELKAQSRFIQIARDPQKRKGVGPDLGVILLSDTDVARIKREKSFYDLLEAREKILSDAQAQDRGLRLILGFPGSDTRWEEIGDGYTYLPDFPSRAYSGGAERERLLDEEGFDYFHFSIGEKEAQELPRDMAGRTTLGGISGGGVWYAPVVKNGAYRPDLMIK